MSNRKILILKNGHKSDLVFASVYRFEILNACASLDGKALQLFVGLKSVCNQFSDAVCDELSFNSERFQQFVDVVYPEEKGTVLTFSIDDIIGRTGEICIKEVDDDIELLWDMACCDKACRSSVYDIKFLDRYRHNEDERDVLVIHNNGHTYNKITTGKYDFFIEKACFEPSGKCLQLMIKLTPEGKTTEDFVYYEIPINSEQFSVFAKSIYCVEFDKSVDFDVDRCKDFFGQITVRKIKNKLFFDWDTIDVEINPCSSGIDYYPIIES